MELAAGELLVGRAWRWTKEQIEKDVEIDRRSRLAEGDTDPPASISVFAVTHDGGDVERTLHELKNSIRKSRNARWLAVVTEKELSNAGFRLVRSEPPPDHHDLILGRQASDAAMVRLEQIFETRTRERLS
ncbi:hypothetical protein [Microbacterium kunmingense]|uniref:hypothetical protein n=1 Tax=Microbacterium kunmingense TaxID=2915939 RepID=UPI00200355CA|nr:hypothetical protein [Microbacterium kunmingense]